MAATGAVLVFELVYAITEFRLQPQMFMRFRRPGYGAVSADHAHQTLRQNHLDRQCHHVARHAHVEQADRCRQCIVGVQRREHQVAGHGGAHADFGGFLIAHLTQQDDVGILAQGGAQNAREA